MPYRVRADESVAEEVPRIACEQIDRAVDEATSVDLSAAEAIHKVRKRCKRIRSLLRLVRRQLGDLYAVENAWYREAAAELSDIRDAQVVAKAFDELLCYFNKNSDLNELADIHAYLHGRLDSQNGDRGVRRGLKRFCDAMVEGRGRIASWPIHDDGFHAVRAGLKRIYSRGRRDMRLATAEPSSDTIHEWRKRVKDHAHHMQLLRSVWMDPMKARRGEAEMLADVLGADHDLAVLRKTLLACPELGGAKALQTVLGLIGRRQVELRAGAAGLGGRLYAEKPEAFTRRIERYWGTWRGQHQSVPSAAHPREVIPV